MQGRMSNYSSAIAPLSLTEFNQDEATLKLENDISWIHHGKFCIPGLQFVAESTCGL